MIYSKNENKNTLPFATQKNCINKCDKSINICLKYIANIRVSVLPATLQHYEFLIILRIPLFCIATTLEILENTGQKYIIYNPNLSNTK